CSRFASLCFRRKPIGSQISGRWCRISWQNSICSKLARLLLLAATRRVGIAAARSLQWNNGHLRLRAQCPRGPASRIYRRGPRFDRVGKIAGGTGSNFFDPVGHFSHPPPPPPLTTPRHPPP